jgi:hypothetical protein
VAGSEGRKRQLLVLSIIKNRNKPVTFKVGQENTVENEWGRSGRFDEDRGSDF